jgi:hypothetical protein
MHTTKFGAKLMIYQDIVTELPFLQTNGLKKRYETREVTKDEGKTFPNYIIWHLILFRLLPITTQLL